MRLKQQDGVSEELEVYTQTTEVELKWKLLKPQYQKSFLCWIEETDGNTFADDEKTLTFLATFQKFKQICRRVEQRDCIL